MQKTKMTKHASANAAWGTVGRVLLAWVALSGPLASREARALDNGLARTPPMGWNSWNLKLGPISAAEVRRITDAIVSTGMRDLGYEYVVIDDCWSENARDAAGNLVPTRALFPEGMKALADYVHDSGLKFGMYATPTTRTCCRHPGSYTHERQDAQSFAAWGVDFLKYDWCGVQSGEQGLVDKTDLLARYATMRDALAATRRPFLFSLCEKGQETGDAPAATAAWSVGIGNMWRNTGDIGANWRSVLSNFDRQIGALELQGPGGWNDPDMLQVGNPGLSDAENRAHFSLWAIIAAPLIAGNDPSNMSAATRATMTNAEVIAVDQDPLGKAGQRVAQVGTTEVWAKPMRDGSKAVLMLNRGTAPTSVTATWAAVGVQGPVGVRDLWAHVDRGDFDTEYSAMVGGHDVVVLRVYPAGVEWDRGADPYPRDVPEAAGSDAGSPSASVDAGASSGSSPVSPTFNAPATGDVSSSGDAVLDTTTAEVGGAGGSAGTTGASVEPAPPAALDQPVTAASGSSNSGCSMTGAKAPAVPPGSGWFPLLALAWFARRRNGGRAERGR